MAQISRGRVSPCNRASRCLCDQIFSQVDWIGAVSNSAQRLGGVNLDVESIYETDMVCRVRDFRKTIEVQGERRGRFDLSPSEQIRTMRDLAPHERVVAL